MDEYFKAFHPGKTSSEVLEGWRVRRSGFQPMEAGEPNTVQVNVTRGMSKEDVAMAAAKLLGLPTPVAPASKTLQFTDCGSFEGDWKWAGGTVLPDGRLVCS